MSDFTDARTAYLANADYAETSSAVKARAFVTACRKLIVLLPTESQGADSRTRMDENIRQFRAEIDEANAWLAVNDSATVTGGGVVESDFSYFRD